MSEHEVTNVRVVTPEELLDDVKADDRAMIAGIISVLGTVQHPECIVKRWKVNPVAGTHYEIFGYIEVPPQGSWQITLEDLELITKVDPLRITSVGLLVSSGMPNSILFTLFAVTWGMNEYAGNTPCIRVTVLSYTEKVLTTTLHVTMVTKRTRPWNPLVSLVEKIRKV